MPQNLGDLSVSVGADIAAFEAGMARVQADLGKVAAAADAAAGRYTDAQGRMRDASGKFVSSATLAAEAAARAGGSLGSLSDVAGRTGASLSGLGTAASKAGVSINSGLVQSIGEAGSSIKSLGQGLSTYLSAPLALLGGSAIRAAADMQALERGFAATYKGAEPLSEALAKVRELAKLPGLGLKEALQGATSLQAAGFSADQARVSLQAFGNALATVGKGKVELDRVSLALTQINNTPFVQGQDLNQLRQTLPQIGEALQKAFGTTSAEGLRALGVTSKQFIATITDEFAKLPPVTGGLKNALENLSDAGTLALSSLGDALNKSFDLEGLAERFGVAVKSIVDSFDSLSPASKQAIFVLGGLGIVVPPLLIALGSLVAAVPFVVGGLEAIGLASTTAAVAATAGAEAIAATTTIALGPIGLIAAGVTAAAVLIYKNWDGIVSYFKGPDGAVFSDLAASVGESLSAVIDAFKALAAGPIGAVLAQLGKVAVAILGKEIQVALAFIASGFSTIAGAVRVVTDLLSGNFNKAINDGAAAARAALKPFQDLLGLSAPKTLTIKEFFDSFAPSAANAAAGVDYFGDEVEKAGKKVQTLKELQKELAVALQQRFADAQAGQDTTADDANIARIRALIAEYKQLPGHASAAEKALAKLRAELARLGVLDNILGDTPSQVEVLERRVNALSGGLKSLVDAGVNPSSAAFRRFVADLVSTSQALDRLRSAGPALDLKPVEVKSLIPQTIGDTLPADVARLLGDYAKQAKPFELPIAVRLKFEATISPGDQIKGAINSALLDIGNGFRTADASLQVFGNSFDATQAKVNTMQQALQDLLAAGVSPLNPAVVQLGEQFRAMSDLANINTAATSALTSGLTQLATGLLEGLGQLAVGNIGLEQFGASILGLIGKLATQVGEAIIAVGVGLLALKFAFTNPFAAIAAGAALVLVGSALGAISSNLASVGTGSGGGSVSAPKTNYSSNAPNAGQQTLKVVAEFKLRGSDLVAVARAQDYRVKRTG